MPQIHRPSPSNVSHSSFAIRILKWLLALALVLVLLASVGMVAVFAFEQSTLRPLAERAVTQFTGRAFSIEGNLDARIGRIVSVSADRIRLANADWGSQNDMLIAEEIELSVDLLSLLSGILVIDNLAIKSGSMLFEQGAQGQSNWAMAESGTTDTGTAGGNASSGADLPLRVAHGELSKIDITVKNPGLTRTLNIRLDSVVQDAKRGDSLSLVVNASIDKRPVKLQSHIGPLKQLLAGREIKFDFKGELDGLDVDADGRVDNLFAPTRSTVHIAADAASVQQVSSMFALPDIGSGALMLDLHLVPDNDVHKLDVVGKVGAVKLNADARLQSLSSIDGSMVKLTAEGPDLAPIAKLTGLAELDALPSLPFSIASNVALSGKLLKIGEITVDAGTNHLAVKGSMSQFPELTDTNLKLEMHGENFLEFSELLGFAQKTGLPAQPYRIQGDLVYNKSNHQTVSAVLALGSINATLDGVITEYPQFEGSQVKYSIEGKNAGDVLSLLKRPPLIKNAFTLEGEVKGTRAGFNIDKTSLTIGKSRLDVAGLIGRDPLRRDSNLSLGYRGSDLDKIATIAGYEGFVPAGAATISAKARAQPDGIHLDSVDFQLDRSRLKASGRIGIEADQADSSVKLSISSENLAGLLPKDLLAYVKAQQAFELSSTITSNQNQLAFENLDVKLGETRLLASGSVAIDPPNRGKTLMQVDLRGPSVDAIIPETLVSYPLPSTKFSAVGGVGFDKNRLSLDTMKVAFGANQLQLSGIIPAEAMADGLDLVIAAKGPDLGQLIATDAENFDLKEVAFDASGKIRIDAGVLSVRDLSFVADRGKVTGKLAVAVEDPRDSGQFDLKAAGKDLAKFVPPISGYRPAAVAFDLDARGSWDSKRLKIEKGIMKLDDSRIEAQGEIDLSTDLADAQLTLSASGKSFASVGHIEGLALPTDPFQIDATLRGNTRGIEIQKLSAVVGESDLRGSFQTSFADKPELAITLKSRILDLARFLPGTTEPATDDPEPGSKSNDDRIIPQIVVPADRLNALNMTASIDIGELRLPGHTLRNIDFDATLQDGDFVVKQIKASATQGELLGHFRMKANGDSVTTSGSLQGINVAFGKQTTGNDAESFPDQNIYLKFATAGSTVRELAANLNGRAQVTGADGRMQNSLALGLFGSFFSELISAINPFVVRETYTTISCFAAYTEIVDGVATINPGAVMQTDKLNMFAVGQVDLKTEQIDLRFNTAARQGLGISVGDFVNPFVGVGGSLAKPRLGLDPKNAMFEGSVAYATGGLSILLKGVWGRWFASENPCAEFKKEADEADKPG